MREGKITHYEPLFWGSNGNFIVEISAGNGEQCLAVYKPRSGERPLWDFPGGTLYQREYASYLFCAALQWGFIPPTVVREGPRGIGSLQLYIEPDLTTDYSTLKKKHHEALKRICLFDILVNNADRKAGHIFRGADGKIWAIDHGLTFHVEHKLRTVIWDFCNSPIPPALLQDLRKAFSDPPGQEGIRQLLSPWLDAQEIRSFLARLRTILKAGRFPHFDPRERNVPWPFY
ncbi:MAG: SCO1664 family protein [Candidatus Tectomicrobia bacterium]|uniref:SCO1664 family protein n=1 Tax=Tectimicrobiota bacterium TaxID=2528274 RepID=A0A932CR41_UNCTE|nr:SCO1664 family protein [Candidatus Tectomicrobia bacterium]